MWLTWVLAWLHVVSAITWLGGGILFSFVVGPSLVGMSPAASGEFLVRVVPKVVRYFQAAAGMTVVFGLLLFYDMGGPSLLGGSTTYGQLLSVGIVCAVAAFVEAEFFAVPAMLRAVRLARESAASGRSEQPAGFPKAIRMAALGGILAVALLILTSVFMVGAGFY